MQAVTFTWIISQKIARKLIVISWTIAVKRGIKRLCIVESIIMKAKEVISMRRKRKQDELTGSDLYVERKRLRISQNAAAKILGIDRYTLLSIEKDRVKLSQDEYKRMINTIVQRVEDA